jgi:hypothetical protein
MMNKRGISEVVNTVLIIVLVVAVAAGVFYFMQKFFSNAKAEAEISKTCAGVTFNSADFCYEFADVQNLDGTIEQKERLVFGVENKESILINGFIIALDYNGGNIITLSTTIDSNVGTNDVKKVTSDFIANPENINQIEIFPKVILNNETSVCPSTDSVIKWSDLHQC